MDTELKDDMTNISEAEVIEVPLAKSNDAPSTIYPVVVSCMAAHQSEASNQPKTKHATNISWCC